jgi:hypothetical protein
MRLSKNSRRFELLACCVILLATIAGCATRPKVDPNVDWNGRIGSYTYGQAIAEIGNPDVVAETNEGLVVDWILKQSPNISFGFGVGNAVYGPHVGTGVGVGTSISPPPHGEYLRLIFDSQGKLKAWNHTKH